LVAACWWLLDAPVWMNPIRVEARQGVGEARAGVSAG